jgi:hypothetical protein
VVAGSDGTITTAGGDSAQPSPSGTQALVEQRRGLVLLGSDGSAKQLDLVSRAAWLPGDPGA